MTDRPFRCSNCGNWYTAVPVKEGDACVQCAEGTHTPHNRSGVTDCHFGQESAHPSEVRMARLLETMQRAVSVLERAGATPTVEALTEAERAFAQAERAERDVADTLTWAGVMELPGLADAPRTQRFKSTEAIEDLVRDSRRPPEDLALLRRATKVCRAMADDVPEIMARARLAMGQARTAAMAPKTKEKAAATA